MKAIIDSKKELSRIIRSAVKDFIHAHPEAMNEKWVESVTKRVTGQIYCHFVHNRIKDGKYYEVDNKGNIVAKSSDEFPVVYTGDRI